MDHRVLRTDFLSDVMSPTVVSVIPEIFTSYFLTWANL